MAKRTQQPKRQVRARDSKGRFVKRAKPVLPADVLRQLGFGQVRVGNIVIPIKRAVLPRWINDLPWSIVERKD
jgi:hypothetical protein